MPWRPAWLDNSMVEEMSFRHLHQVHRQSQLKPNELLWISSRDNTHLWWHRQAHPELRSAYSSGRVGRSDWCTLCLLSYTDFQSVVLSSLTAIFDISFQAVTANVVRDVCTKYIYDKCPAVAAVGAFSVFVLFVAILSLFLQWFFFSWFRPLASLHQGPLNSCLTTTDCAVLCTGWGFKMSRIAPSVLYFPHNLISAPFSSRFCYKSSSWTCPGGVRTG